MVCGDEKIVSGDVAAAAERRSVRRDIPGYLMPFLFFRVGDCEPCGESPSVDIKAADCLGVAANDSVDFDRHRHLPSRW